MKLSLNDLEQVSGGGQLQDLINKIVSDGHSEELKTILKTQGKAAAAAKCCEYYPECCGFAAAAVTMLK